MGAAFPPCLIDSSRQHFGGDFWGERISCCALFSFFVFTGTPRHCLMSNLTLREIAIPSILTWSDPFSP